MKRSSLVPLRSMNERCFVKPFHPLTTKRTPFMASRCLSLNLQDIEAPGEGFEPFPHTPGFSIFFSVQL